MKNHMILEKLLTKHYMQAHNSIFWRSEIFLTYKVFPTNLSNYYTIKYEKSTPSENPSRLLLFFSLLSLKKL